MNQRQVSTTSYPMSFLMVDSTDHVTGKTGLSPTVTVSKNGAAFGSPAGAVTELANGWYKLAGNATDRDTLGEFKIHATGSGADPTDRDYEIVTVDPFAALGAVASVAGNVAGSVASVAATVNATLVASGLDAISVADPGGVAGHTSLPKMLVALYRRFYRRVTKSTTQIKAYGDDNTTVNTTQTISDDGAGNQVQGTAS